MCHGWKFINKDHKVFGLSTNQPLKHRVFNDEGNASQVIQMQMKPILVLLLLPRFAHKWRSKDFVLNLLWTRWSTIKSCQGPFSFCYITPIPERREKTIWTFLGSNPARSLRKRALYPLGSCFLCKPGLCYIIIFVPLDPRDCSNTC